ncbi:MAG: hypothetical protein GY820_41405, partial [Gammaproteobacteria bacterium]|nr:hypothetical protein [Gammaproteobacteria bacterium]
ITTVLENLGNGDAEWFSVDMYITLEGGQEQYIDSWWIDAFPGYATGNLTITFIGGLPEGTHAIRVVADTVSGELNTSNNSLTRNITWFNEATPTAPEPPTNIQAISGPGNGEVTVNWSLSTSPDVDHYKIYQGTNPGSYTYTYNYIPWYWNSGTVLSGLTNGATYYYAMTAVDGDGLESQMSAETSVIPQDTGEDVEAPTNPGALTLFDPSTGTDLDLSWGASSDNVGVSHYLIFRATNSASVSEYYYDSGYPQVTSQTSYRDSGLSSGVSYYYKVLAVDAADNWSGLSNLTSGSPGDIIPPAAPNGLEAYAEHGVVQLWWNAPTTNSDGTYLDDLEGYNIYRGISSGNYDPVPLNSSYVYGGLYYSDMDVVNDETYYYIIKAVDYDGNESSASVEVSATPGDLNEPPTDPANLRLTAKDDGLMLVWDSSYGSGLAGYKVYRGTVSGSHTLLTTLGIDNTHFDRNVVAGQTYYYVVTAFDDNDNESGSSNEASGKIGEGDIWIIEPTEAEPATLDFSYLSEQSQGDIKTPTGLLTTSGNRAKIIYDYNAFVRLVSAVTLEIIDSSGKIVYKDSEWEPPLPWGESEPYFIWDGLYNTGADTGKCVPDDRYSVKLYLELALLETLEPNSVVVRGCDASDTEVTFTPNSGTTDQYYGVDDYTEPDDPWQSVKVGGSQDIVATILPSEATQRIYFTSSNPAEATVSP